MDYWNKENFEGMEAIGEHYSQRPGFELFSKYCLLKGQGLKKQAVEAINEFVALLEKKETQQKREIALELTELSYNNKAVNQLLSFPLFQWLIAVFEEWSNTDSGNVLPERWLGFLTHDMERYEKALKLEPNDQISLIALCNAHISDVDYQTHHLFESRLIGELDEAKQSLETAGQLLSRITASKFIEFAHQEINYYGRMLEKWEEYSSQVRQETFQEWCEKQGESFSFGSVVYYE